MYAPVIFPGASSPMRVALSDDRLVEVEPDLFGDTPMLCGPSCAALHPPAYLRQRIADNLYSGDTQPALVVSTSPLVVAVYSVDMDCAALLRFPEALTARHGLAVGTRLVSANAYWKQRDPGSGIPLFACDLVPGPERSGTWQNVTPTVADFLTDDRARLATQRASIPESAWVALEALARVRIRRFGLETARDGRPSRCAMPIPIGEPGAPSFRSLGPHFGTVMPGESRRARYLAWLVTAALFLVGVAAQLVMGWPR